jgi:hypothetical protein
MGVMPDSPTSQRQLVLQTFCEEPTFQGICEKAQLDCSTLFKRNALDGDPYTLVLAVTVAGGTIKAIRDVVIALIRERHPLKLSIGEVTVGGASVDDLPKIEEFIQALGHSEAAHPPFPPPVAEEDGSHGKPL